MAKQDIEKLTEAKLLLNEVSVHLYGDLKRKVERFLSECETNQKDKKLFKFSYPLHKNYPPNWPTEIS